MFGCYFHQDWDTEGSDWPDLVRNYLRESTADAKATAVEINSLLAECETDQRLEDRVLDEFGCCYDARPEAAGPGVRAWLAQVAAMLQAF